MKTIIIFENKPPLSTWILAPSWHMNFSTKSVGGISRHIFSSEPSLQSIIPSQCLDASILVPLLHSNNSTWMFLKTGSDLMIYAWSFYKPKTILDPSKLFWTRSNYFILNNAGLEAAFQVPMPGDSGLSLDAGSISNYCLTQEIFTPNPADCCPSISLKQCFGQ